MKFKKPNGGEANVNINPYLIDWDRVKEVSKPQAQVKRFLRPYWCGHIVLEEFRVPSKLWRIDLMNVTRHIAVEVSPAGSHSFNAFFHKTRPRFGAAINRELDKSKWLEQNGFKLVEVFEDDFVKLSPEWFLSTYGVTL